MNKLIQIISLSLLFCATSFSQWQLQTSGTGFDIFSASFPSASTGYICGYGNFINKTTNGGSSWINLSFPGTAHNKQAIFFTSENTGYMCSTSDTVLVTTNGGSSWTTSYYPLFGYSLQFINTNTGWAGGINKIIRTTNAGASWTLINVQTTGTIFFADAITGWTVTISSPNSTIHKTTDGGFNWTPQYTTTDFANIYSLCFINSLTGWAAGYREIILKTTNGGASWTEQRLVPGAAGLYSIDFINENTGWISGDNAKLLHTSNGGALWDQFSLSGGRMIKIIFVNDQTGWTAGQFNRVYKTTNNGGFTPVEPISNQVPDDYKLFQNYPNPFNPKSNIKYQISKSNQNVQIAVFDIQGKEVIKLVNEIQAAGTYKVDFDGTNLPSGIYFYSLITDGNTVDTKKMILLR